MSINELRDQLANDLALLKRDLDGIIKGLDNWHFNQIPMAVQYRISQLTEKEFAFQFDGSMKAY